MFAFSINQFAKVYIPYYKFYRHFFYTYQALPQTVRATAATLNIHQYYLCNMGHPIHSSTTVHNLSNKVRFGVIYGLLRLNESRFDHLLIFLKQYDNYDDTNTFLLLRPRWCASCLL